MPSLLLSGWAQPSNALQMLEPDALLFDYSAHTPEMALRQLKQLKRVESVIAWSLGGLLALNAIAEGIIAPRHLTLIATPYQFVSGNDVKGMDPLTFDQFRENYHANPARTKTRFHALVAKGDQDAAQIMQNLTHHPEVEETSRWLPWLDYLARNGLHNTTLKHQPHTLIVHGSEDAIVPFSQTDRLAKLLPGATVEHWQNVGHAPHLHNAEKLRAAISNHRAEVAA